MKSTVGAVVLALLCAGCSSTPTSDGGTTTGGTVGGTTGGTSGGCMSTTTGGGGSGGCVGSGPCVSINELQIFPPAAAWLTSHNLPIPSMFDGGYALTINGTSLSSSGVLLTVLGQLPLDSTTPAPPYVFGIDAGAPDGLGLVVTIQPLVVPDGGVPAPQLTCAQLALAMDAGAAAVTGYFDYIVPAGMQPGKALTKPTTPLNAGVYGVPASFVAQLSCAAGISTSGDGGLLGGGIGLFYFTQYPNGVGTPVSGASIANNGNGLLYYYSNNFSVGSMTGTTDATGVAAISAVQPEGSGLPPSMVLTSPCQNLSPARVQTNQGAILEILPYQPGDGG
jgi:hypothetical protein